MSEYVWSTQDMLFANGIFEARLLPGQVWWADDPLVLARPEFFSATPLVVLSTAGRPNPGPTPVLSQEERVAQVAEKLYEPEQVVAAVEASDLSQVAVKRGPGRPRKDQARG